MVERPADLWAICQQQVPCKSLNVVEVMDLIALLQILHHPLESQVEEMQVT